MIVPYFSDTKQVSFVRTKQNIIQKWEPCLSGERESRVGEGEVRIYGLTPENFSLRSQGSQ